MTGSFGVEALTRATGVQTWLVPTADGEVRAVAAGPRAVYVAGRFRRIGGRPRHDLAALAPRTGAVLHWRAPDVAPESDDTVAAVALAGSRLFLSGFFDTVGGARRRELAALDAATGRLTNWNPARADEADRILVTHGRVFGAGRRSGGVWNARTGATDPWSRRVAGTYVAAAGARVYLAGNCLDPVFVDRRPRPENVVAIDVAAGRVEPWAPQLGHDPCIQAIAATADDVLVSGSMALR